MDRIKLRIEGMHCSACAQGIIANLSKESGVLDVSVNAITGKGRIKYEEGRITQERIIRLIESYGFKAFKESSRDQEERELQELGRRFFLCLPLFLVIFGLHMFFPHEPLYLYTQFLLASVVQFVGGSGFYKGAGSLWRTKSADMNLLIVIGTSAAYLYSCIALWAPSLFPNTQMGLYFEGSSAVITFVLLGEWLKARAKKRSGESVRALASLLPQRVRLWREGAEVEVELSEVGVNEISLVRAGEKIPLDGEIVEGEAEVDSSHISGEYLPVHKKVGDGVVGGSIAVNGYLKVRVLKSAQESLLYEMVDLLEEAQSQKPPIGKLADQIASIFVPAVLFLSLLTLGVWIFWGDGYEHAFLASVAVLIISCPCALGLATPISIVTAISRGAREGILIKNPDVIERAAVISKVVLDKTGTLTQGMLSISKVRWMREAPEGFFEMLLGIESTSAHPISLALTRYAKEQIKEGSEAALIPESPQNFIGLGLAAKFGGEEFVVGNKRLMIQKGILSDEALLESLREEFLGLSTIYVAYQGEMIAAIGVEDSLRQGAREMLEFFKKRGIEPVILSGDSKEAVLDLAQRLEIERFYAEVLPKDKHRVIKELKEEGGVLFVGDGVNDALALEEADMGIALSSGTAIAQESGDILLMKEELTGVSEALELCLFALRNIKQNLFFAYLYNTILIPVAAGALYPWFGILLQPSFAGAAMALSSVSVVSNALRIGRWKSQGALGA